MLETCCSSMEKGGAHLSLKRSQKEKIIFQLEYLSKKGHSLPHRICGLVKRFGGSKGGVFNWPEASFQKSGLNDLVETLGRPGSISTNAYGSKVLPKISFCVTRDILERSSREIISQIFSSVTL